MDLSALFSFFILISLHRLPFQALSFPAHDNDAWASLDVSADSDVNRIPAASGGFRSHSLTVESEHGTDEGRATSDGSPPAQCPDSVGDTAKPVCMIPTSEVVNCTRRGLRSVPRTDWPEDITVYDLSDNCIQFVPANAFSRYKTLEQLNLANNEISRIDGLAFAGLASLNLLDLSANKLTMTVANFNVTFPQGVFDSLVNLQTLYLNKNNPDPSKKSLDYPGSVLSGLSSLTELHMDGLKYGNFSSDFSNLTSLTKLSLSGVGGGFCAISFLTNTTFQYLTRLKYLDLNTCTLAGSQIENGTFIPLKFLEFLDISNNEGIGIYYLSNIFIGLQNTTTLKTLFMDKIVSSSSLSICLNHKYIKYYPKSVQNLSIRDNRLECIDRHVLEIVGKNLTHLDISKNIFIFGTYVKDFPKLVSIKRLLMDSSIDSSRSHLSPFTSNMTYNPIPDRGNCSTYQSVTSGDGLAPFTFHLPPFLETIELISTHLYFDFSTLHVSPNNSLQSIILEQNYITALSGSITYLSKLKVLKIVNGLVSYIGETFFKDFSSLEALNLRANYIGQFFQANPNTRVFQYLKNVTFLGLSDNGISVLPKDLFKGMDNLVNLTLSGNSLSYLTADITSLGKLTHLWLDSTSIGFLDKKTRRYVDTRLSEDKSFSVNISNCPIFCDCSNVGFVRWMVSSKALKAHTLKCQYPDHSVGIITDNYTLVMENLSRECTPHKVLFYVAGLATVLALVLILGALIYRYRWKLRYLYYAAYLTVNSGRRYDVSRGSFSHDAFICYAEHDRDFVISSVTPALESRGIAVFLHARDFAAGDFIGSNIVRAVRACRYTLVVLSRALAQSSWCKYEIQMAIMESANRGSPVLIFLLMDGVSERDMGAELLNYVRSNTYIPFPSDGLREDRDLAYLWERLAFSLRD